MHLRRPPRRPGCGGPPPLNAFDLTFDGARSFTAIAERAADADGATLAGLGVTGAAPSESTFRRTLQSLDGDVLDEAAGAWAQQRALPAPGTWRVIAVDGKTLRGSGGDGDGRHLLAALDHAHGVVLGQVEVGAKTNEIPMLPALLDRIDLAGAIVTADRALPLHRPTTADRARAAGTGGIATLA